MNIINRFIKKFFNVFVVLVVFLTLNVTSIKAETEYTEDNIFYAIGSFINSTQKGISKRINEIDIVNLGKNYAKSLIDNGSRMSDIVRVRGNEFLFNPHGKTNIGNAIDSVYGIYSDFANYAVSKVESDRYIVNINKTYINHYEKSLNGKQGFMVVWGNPNNNSPSGDLDYHNVNIRNVANFSRYTVHADAGASTANLFQRIERYGNYSFDRGVGTSTVGRHGGTPLGSKPYGAGARIPSSAATSSDITKSVRFERIVFHNKGYSSDNDIVPYNRDNIPTKDEFVSNIEETYEPNKFYTYNFDEILNETTVINNQYITNNYITVEEYVPDDDDDADAGVGSGKDYTSVLGKILQAIKDLPKNIADKLDFPESSGEEGGGFWSGLFGAIGDLVSGMFDFLTSIPNLFIELFDGLLGLVEKVVELFVPSAEQVEELKGSLQLLVDDLTGKFDFVLEPVNQIKTVYSEPKSIYDLTIEYDEQVIHVVPSFLKSSLDKLKVLLNGAVVLTTFITIYKRFVGREDLIK